jgi:hypothetical protein
MDRMEYDPEGGNYLPISQRETGATMMVVGVIMLIASAGWGLFVGWDRRAGNMFMQVIFTVVVIIALLLLAGGLYRKSRLTK